MFRAIAYDQDGVCRVWGEGKTEATAIKQVEWTKKEYHLDGHRTDVRFVHQEVRKV